MWNEASDLRAYTVSSDLIQGINFSMEKQTCFCTPFHLQNFPAV